jgi:serine/threonine protein kinase
VTVQADPRTGERIAVKHIHKEFDESAFLREVETLAMLNHPCVLRIVGWAFRTSETAAQIQTEYAENRSLREVLEKVALEAI